MRACCVRACVRAYFKGMNEGTNKYSQHVGLSATNLSLYHVILVIQDNNSIIYLGQTSVTIL